uniref:Ig-like domain-containing protein n=1 Tax=Scleropages formosus TaxID=113540 RepID=A0A8C9VS16_SCLFO
MFMKTYTVKDTVGHISVVFAGSQSEKRVRNVTVLKGQSITVPCFYHRCDACTKQLCKGEKEANCPVRSNVASMSVSDDPVQGVFTVSMKDLQKKDSGMYMCVLDRNGHFLHYIYVQVCSIDTPDMSVKDNMVEAQLGDSVTVHCFYSHSYRDREKKWCRSEKNSFCVRSWTRGKSRQRVTLKVDSALGVFSVTVRDLEQKDRGWYWCSVGDRLFPVHISVTQKRQSK